MVITCSDTRTPHTDTSGQLIQKLLKEQGHTVAAYHLVKDEPSKIKTKIKVAVTNKKRVADLNRGTIWTSEDFDQPLPDEFWLGHD